MKNKKLAILAALCLATTTAAVAAGCKKTPPVEVALNAESLELAIGASETLISTYSQEVSGATFVYQSSNPGVVTVDEAGKITAVSKGTATITVTYGKATDSCTVTVGLGGNVPMLVVPNAEEEVTLNMWTTLDLTGSVLFDGNTYTDATLTYDVEDSTVGSVTNGVFTPAGFGETEVTINATWRGFTLVDAPTLSQTVSISVDPYWEYTINGEELVNTVTLYTIAEEGYAKETDFVLAATVNGEPLDTTIEVTAGTKFVTYDATAQKLTANGFVGEATISVSATIEGETTTKEITVNVLPTIYNHADVENFSAIHGDVTVGESLKAILGENLVTAYTEDGETLKVDGNKVYGVFDGLQRDTETNTYERTIIVCSNTKGVKMTVKGYDGLFSKAQDLAVLNVNTDVKKKLTDGSTINAAIDEEKGMQKWENVYFVLANNIDASEYEHETNGLNINQRGITSYAYPCGFYNSVFDGQGYTIKGLTLNEHGLFGYVKDSVIKNVAFVETTLADVDYATTIAQWVVGGEISNVYVSYANTQISKKGALFVGGLSDVTLKAVVIETKADLVDSTSKLDGVLFYQNPDITGATEAAPYTPDYSEVYVISNNVFGSYSSEKANNAFYAENGTKGTEEGKSYFAVAGVKQYAPGAEMTGATFEKFDTAFWTITNGKPVWNTADDEIAPPVEDEEEEDDQTSDSVVDDFDPDWLN